MNETIFSLIDSYESLAVELETELCKRPAVSPESGGSGELKKCEFLEAWLRAHGIDDLERCDAPDKRAGGGIRPNLIASLASTASTGGKNRDGPCFWIMSHIDVVPPGEISLWKSDPWTAVLSAGEDGKKRITGRGVEDNQQGLVSSVLAVLALKQQGLAPPHPVKLLFVSDEENGSSFGIDWLIKNRPELFRQGGSALVPDSGDDQGGTIEIAEKNMVWARFVTRGFQAHGSRPDQGVNAHLAGADLAVRLHYGLSEKFADRDPLFAPDYSTFQPTKKEANVPNINTIPGEDVFCMDMRILPRYSVDSVLGEIDRIKSEIEAKHKVTVEYTLAQRMESKSTSAEALLIKRLSKNIEKVYGLKPKPVGIGGGTVAAYLRNIGIDAAVWCRICESAHQPNEYALVENILGDAKVMALMMLEE
ncbi:MAG: M20 family metallo-hydrolase [Treponema sp.]|jgi:succinyl-diaminopimelate desuccinylase|nr:M20 family metallo-hydrolase [Treponema sp.]